MNDAVRVTAMAGFFLAGGGLGYWAGTGATSHAQPVAVHFSPEEDLEAVDVGLIRSAAAGDAINAALYVATDYRVIGALADAAGRGVKVRLYLDAEQAVKTNWRSNPDHPMHRLVGRGGEIRIKAVGGTLMHLKGYTVGTRLLRTGSANVSIDGLKRQDNDLIVIRQADAVVAFNQKFEAMWVRLDNVMVRD
jgi:phosphatidylserine/phosphatidylglycerophosphate/cardiolipin synthase-like enzyme